MVLLAGIPLATPDAPYIDPFQDTRTLAFRSLDGKSLLPFTGDEFISMWGLQNLDIPDRDVAIDLVPGMDGGRIGDINIGPRTISMPIFFGSNSGHIEYLNRRDGLRSLFNHRGVDFRTTDGTFDLVSNSRDGTRERALRCQYLTGLNGQWDQGSAGTYWETVGLSLLATRVYWSGQRWTTPPIVVPAAVSFFGTFPPQLSSSRAFGAEVPVVVDGDVPSWAQIDITGPASTVTVTSTGLSVSIPAGLGSGEVARIVTNPRGRSALFNGVKDWSRIGPSTRWQPLTPGLAHITITVTGATAATSAVVSGDTLWESPW